MHRVELKVKWHLTMAWLLAGLFLMHRVELKVVEIYDLNGIHLGS